MLGLRDQVQRRLLDAQDLAELAAAVAGAAVFLYLLGAGVLWVRYEQADLPAGQAVSLATRESLMETGFSGFVFPYGALLAFTAIALYGLHRLLLVATNRTRIKRHRFRRNVTVSTVIAGVLISPPSVRGIAVSVVLLGYLGWAAHRVVASEETAFPTRRVIAGALLSIAAVVLMSEVRDPPDLEQVVVDVQGLPSVEGLYISQRSEAIYVGREGKIVGVPNGRVEEIRIDDPPPEPDEPASLLEYVIGVDLQ